METFTVREWYVSAFPDDELGADIMPCLTFLNIVQALCAKIDIYTVIGVSDSIVRERVFSKLAEVLGVNYGMVYDLWLESARH